MSSRALTILSVLGVVAWAAIAAQTPGGFRVERPIVTMGTGPYRLAVDVPLLAGATEGATDLRLFDASNREVPFLFVRPAQATATWQRGALLAIAPEGTATRKTSGFEVDLGEAARVDRLRVRGLPPGFLKRVVLEGSGDRSRWTLLAGEGTLFDLPDAQLQQLELPFAPGMYRYLRVIWDDSSSGRLPMPAAAEARRVIRNAPPAPLRAPVALERRPSEPGRSRYLVRLPGPRLPIVGLVLDVSADRVLREAEVSESRLSGGEAVPVALGRATLRRSVVGTVAASDLRIPIGAPSEPVVNLTIEDNDNPPLAVNGITAEFAEQPWIYFEVGGGPIVARYGSANRRMPLYDLEAVRGSLQIDDVAEARWGEPNIVAAPEERATAPLPVEGSPIDMSLFRHVRDLPAGDAGLVALPLDAAVLAESGRPGKSFADVRIIDSTGRQVPYLVERRSEPLALSVTLEPASSNTVDTSSGRRTVYRLRLPFAQLPSARLVLTTEARVFDRGVQIGIERPPDRRRRETWLDWVAGSRWLHADRDRPAPPLQLTFGPVDATELLVVVDEGDNRALPLGPAQLLLPSYRLRFFRAADTPLKLAYGRDDLSPPRYDLALLAPQVLGVAATEISAGAATPTAAAATTPLVSPLVFWSVLSVAVVVLIGFVVKLIGKTG